MNNELVQSIPYVLLLVGAAIIGLAWLLLPLLLLSKLGEILKALKKSNEYLDVIQNNQYIAMQNAAPPQVETQWAKSARETLAQAQVEMVEALSQPVETQPLL